MFDIKPDIDLPTVTVNCRKNTSNGMIVTELGHNKEGLIKVYAPYNGPCGWSTNITYAAGDFKAVTRLVDQSASCKQRTYSKCRDSPFTYLGDNLQYNYVTDRNYQKLNYWGGGNEQHYCACGKTKNCYNNEYQCNCDINNPPILEDYGDVTDKSKLPLTKICAGDTGYPGEFREFIIGKVICHD